MALTLNESAKLAALSGDVHRQTIIEVFADSSPFLAALPFTDISGGAYKYDQEHALPGIAFRGLNEAYAESTGVINPMVEALTIVGGDLDVDKALTKMHGMGVRGKHEVLKAKALGQKIAYSMIKGDSLTTQKEFDGLQVRLVGSQIITNGGTSGGDPLSLAKLDEAIDATDSPNAIVTSKPMARRMTQASRNTAVGGHIEFTQDTMGRRQTSYMGLPLLVVDENSMATEYKALAFNEAASGGGTTATSLYVVSLGEGMLSGIQNGEMEVDDLGQIDDKPVLRTRIEWLVSLLLEHPRAATRLWSISDAAVVV